MKVYNTKEVFYLIEDIKKRVNYICSIIFNSLILISSILFIVFKNSIDNDINLLYIIIMIIICLLIITFSTLFYKKIILKKVEGEINISKNALEYINFFNNKIKSNFKAYLIFIISLSIAMIISLLKIVLTNQSDKLIPFIICCLTLSIIVTMFSKRLLIKKNLGKVEFKCDAEINIEDNYTFKRAKVRNIIYVVIYAIITITLSILFGYYTDAWYSIWIVIIIFALIFLLNALIVNPFSSWRQFEKKKLSVKLAKIIIIVLIFVGIFYVMELGSFYMLPYVSFTNQVESRDLPITYNEDDGSFVIVNQKNTDFKVLQLTDIHIGGSFITKDKDKKALETVRSLIAYTSPDLIIVTGDIVYPFALQSFNFNNYSAFSQFAMFMNNIGIPWAFTYGNHDTESYATNTHEDFLEILNNYSFNKNGKNLLYTDFDRQIDGRSNQLIVLKNWDNSINQLLFLLDSNSYIDSAINNYDYIHDDQVAWYRDRIRYYSSLNLSTVNSLAFFHIPLTETKEAVSFYEDGLNEVTYLFGQKREEVSSSDYSSKLFDVATELGSTKAMFYGHDHLNTIGLEYRGIKLVYGMSIDYLATPKIAFEHDQRGGTLITIHEDSTFDINQIKYIDIK